MSEQVLIIPNSLLTSELMHRSGHLIRENKADVFNKILEHQGFMPRDAAEYDFNYKQVIPYVVIRHDRNYLLLKRLNKQTEKRLHEKYSLGIGGHVNPDPSAENSNVIMNGLYKELNEEVALGHISEMNFIGVINDDSNSVSRVHLGLLYVLDVETPECRVLETEKMTASWISESQLKEYYDRLETWSQIVYDQYIKDPGL